MLQPAIPVHDGVVADHARPLDRHALLNLDAVAEKDRPVNTCTGGDLHIGAQDQIAALAHACKQGRISPVVRRRLDKLGGLHRRCIAERSGQPDFAADEVGVGAHVLADCADITPVALGHVGLEPLPPLQEIGEEIGGKVIGDVVGDIVQNRRFEHIDAGVHPVGADGAPIRFFDELGDATAFVADDCAIFERIGNGIDGECGESADGDVVLDGGLEVEVGQGVATDDEKGVVEMGGGVLDTAGGAEGHILDDIGDFEAEATAVAIEVLDHGGHILESNDDLGNAVIFEQLENMAEDRFVDKGYHRLGTPNRQGAQAGAFTAGHDYGSHNLCPVTNGQWSVASGLRWPQVTGNWPLRLYRRPGIVALVIGWQGILARSEQFADATAQGILFGNAEKQIQGALHWVGVNEMLQRLQVGEQPLLNGFSGELPDNSTQLVLMVEADTVVDGPHMRARRFPPPTGNRKSTMISIKTVAGLAVGVVDEIVEEGQTAQGRGVTGILAHIEIVYVRITLDEELDAARPPRPVAQDSGGHEAPTEGLADDKGGGLALAEGARRKIPQRILAAAGFVDGRNLVLVVMNDCQKGVVGAVWQQSFLFDFAFCQRAQYLAGRSRGQPLAARALVHDAAVV